MLSLILTIIQVLAVIAAAALIFWGANLLVDRLPDRARDATRPWIFAGPALLFLGVGLVWPTAKTVWLSVRSGPNGDRGFTLDNYKTIFTDDQYFSLNGFWSIFSSRLFLLAVVLAVVAGGYILLQRSRNPGQGVDLGAPLPTLSLVGCAILVLLAVFSTLQGVIWNNLWWVASVTGLSTVIGLVLAILADRSKGEQLAKSLIFMPMAISMVGAAVIWRFVYYPNTSFENIGLLNAIIKGLGLRDTSIDFYSGADLIPWNNFFIMIIMIWIQVGFTMIVFSAAIKAVPTELIEASRIDGASELQAIWRVVIPQVRSTIVVVVTTLIVVVMKVFDLVKATTNGRAKTDVLANTMYENLRNADFTQSAAFAMIIVALVLPVMYLNVRRSAKEV